MHRVGCAGRSAADLRRHQAFDAGEEPFELTADAVEYDRARDLYIASGDVEIRQGDRTLAADWIAFSNTTQRGVASGNVELREGGETLLTQLRRVRRRDDAGRALRRAARRAREPVPHVGRGDREDRASRPTASRRGASPPAAAEPGERDPWEIQAEHADLEIGGYGTARNTTFDVLGVPVAWLPWMIYPLQDGASDGAAVPAALGRQHPGLQRRRCRSSGPRART